MLHALEQNPLLDIAAVEREVGVGKDTLRVWERRYGFPQPLRDAKGGRLYPADQVERLRLVKRLMDQGLRPGALLALDVTRLQQQLSSGTLQPRPAQPPQRDPLLDLLTNHDIGGLRAELGRRLASQGLRQFVMDTVVPLNRDVGEDWAAGRIDVAVEHLYSELMQNQLRAAIHAVPPPGEHPRVLLTTLRGEEHVIGLLMAEAIFLVEGAACLSLGAQTPVREILSMAQGIEADILALSFAGSYPVARAREALKGLRAGLPGSTELWVGGGGMAKLAKQVPDVKFFSCIEDLPAAVADWRQRAKVAEAAKKS